MLAIIFAACVPTTITGSGNVVTKEEYLDGVDRVDVGHNFEVTLPKENTSGGSSVEAK